MLQQDKIEQLAEGYLKKYPNETRALSKSAMNRALPHGCQPANYYFLGKMLDQVEECKKFFNESDQGDLSVYPTVYKDAVTFMYSTSPIGILTGNQTIDAQQDLIYFKQTVAKTTRGDIAAGNVLFNSLAAPTVFDDGTFTGETRNNVQVMQVSSGWALNYTNLALGGSDTLQVPINPQRCFLSGSYGVTISSTPYEITFANVQVVPLNDGSNTGTFSYGVMTGASNTNFVGFSGTVNFTTGLITNLQFSQLATSTLTLNASYQTLVESASDDKVIDTQYVSKLITADTYTLKGLMGFFKAFELQKRMGIDLEADLTEDLATLLNQTFFSVVLNLMKTNIPSGNTATWYQNPPSGVSYEMHQKSFPLAVAMASDAIVASAGRGMVNYMAAGRNAATILATMPEFQLAFDGTSFGPHIYGSYKGIPVVRVPYAGQLDSNTILCGYKGSDFEAPVSFCTYMPMVITNTKDMSPNPWQTQKAMGAMVAIDQMIPNLQAKIVINTSGFNSLIAMS